MPKAKQPARRQVRSGETVTYHGDGGDVQLEVLSFDGLSRANLQATEAIILRYVSEGPAIGQWSR